METVYYKYVNNFFVTFTSIVWEALPFIVLGAVIAGLLEEFLPQRLIAKYLPRAHGPAIVAGGLLGIIFPMCECGIIPVMRRLLRKGLPLSCCIAYLLAGPIINAVVILSTYVAFANFTDVGVGNYQLTAGWMVAFRVGLGFVVAVTTASVVERLYQKHGNELLTPLATPKQAGADEAEEAAKDKSAFGRASRDSETALHDFSDSTVFLCLGALLASLIRLWLTHDTIGELSQARPVITILLMMTLAVVLCLCSEADAFLAASFTKLIPSAKLSFLVLGPMFDFKLLFMYTRVFRPRLIRTIVLCVVIQVFIYCTLLHFYLSTWQPEFMRVGSAVPAVPASQ